MTYSCERLAYWYFRLNGFLTTENFIVHPDRGRNQGTDADLLAVRFGFRAENLDEPMPDDPKVSECNRLVNIVIAETKTGACALNGPWTDRDKKNMERVICAIGCVDTKAVDRVATHLYDNGSWQNETVRIRLFAVGETKAALSISNNQQITWSEVIHFCITRFKAYDNQKSSVGQWPDDGRALQELARNGDVARIRRLFRLRPESAKNVQAGML